MNHFNLKHLRICIVVILLTIVVGVSESLAEIKPYSGNPKYWQYKGQPTLLIGGSALDSLFQYDSAIQPWLTTKGGSSTLAGHLDLIKNAGGNYVRCTMNSRSYDANDNSGDPYRWNELPYPFKKVGSKYDLNQWNTTYWNKLESLLDLAEARNIIVQIEFWDRWNESNYGGDGWTYSPWNPGKNLDSNYTWAQSGLSQGATGFYNKLHYAATDGNTVLLNYQKKFVKKVIDTVIDNGHKNVIFQVDNESGIGKSGAADLGPDNYWAQYARNYAKSKPNGRDIYVTTSRRFHSPYYYYPSHTEFKDWNNPEIKKVITNINDTTFNFVDIAQNNGNYGETQYNNYIWYRQQMTYQGKTTPINAVKAYYFHWTTGSGFGSRLPGDDAEAGAKLWRAVFAGVASFRFHRNAPVLDTQGTIKENGFGADARARKHFRSVRRLQEKLNMFTVTPRNDLITGPDRKNDEAYCLAKTGSQYAVFFTGKHNHSVKLDLSSLGGAQQLYWLNVATSTWNAPVPITGGAKRTITAPGSGHWVAFVGSTPAGFVDVPPGYWAEDAIYDIYEAGITTGCSKNPLKYCPEDTVTRAQMSVFVGRGTHGSNFTPPPATGIFSDVAKTYWAAKWIEQFYNDGITGGCKQNPLRFCPEDQVTRSQMAIFLLRAKHGKNYQPPAATGIFSDVPKTYWAAKWIEQFYREGITTGCSKNPLKYCPDNSVTRAQMAVFLTRTFNLSADPLALLGDFDLDGDVDNADTDVFTAALGSQIGDDNYNIAADFDHDGDVDDDDLNVFLGNWGQGT